MKAALYLLGLMLVIEGIAAFRKSESSTVGVNECRKRARCVQCEDYDRTVCCPLTRTMKACCAVLYNINCKPKEVYNSTSDTSYKIHKVPMPAPIVMVQQAHAKLRKINPSLPGSTVLEITKRTDSTFATVRLTRIKTGKYLVNYGCTSVCGYNCENSKPLITTPISVDQDTEVTLTVPSLDPLENQPVTLYEVPPQGKKIPVGCGNFVVL